jgi:hypothetical protein
MMKRGLVWLGLLSLVVALVSFGGAVTLAKEKQTVQAGMGACKAWCDNNRTGNQLTQCYKNCETYWACNGSDSTEAMCRSVNESLAAEVSRPQKRSPHRKQSPAKTGASGQGEVCCKVTRGGGVTYAWLSRGDCKEPDRSIMPTPALCPAQLSQ